MGLPRRSDRHVRAPQGGSAGAREEELGPPSVSAGGLDAARSADPAAPPASGVVEDAETATRLAQDTAGTAEDESAPVSEDARPMSRKERRRLEKRLKRAVEEDRVAGRHGGAVDAIRPFTDDKGRLLPIDGRADRRRTSRFVAAGIGVLLFSVVGIGVYQAVVPHGVDRSEVASIAAKALGQTDFPVERGRGFATGFATAYLSADGSEASERAISYYYTGAINPDKSVGGSEGNSLMRGSGLSYRILIAPSVYEVLQQNGATAVYKVGALVQDQEKGGDGSTQVNPSPHWIFMEISLYYDKDKDRMVAGSNSPSLVAAPSTGAVGDGPAYTPPGTGEKWNGGDKERTLIESGAFGFIDAYAKASPTSHTLLDQYVSTDADVSIFAGMNGEFEPQGGKAESSSQLDIYAGEKGDEVKVLATITWHQVLPGSSGSASSSSSVSRTSTSGYNFTSRYVITMTKKGEKWLVSRFAPYRLVVPEKGGGEPVS